MLNWIIPINNSHTVLWSFLFSIFKIIFQLEKSIHLINYINKIKDKVYNNYKKLCDEIQYSLYENAWCT